MESVAFSRSISEVTLAREDASIGDRRFGKYGLP